MMEDEFDFSSFLSNTDFSAHHDDIFSSSPSLSPTRDYDEMSLSPNIDDSPITSDFFTPAPTSWLADSIARGCLHLGLPAIMSQPPQIKQEPILKVEPPKPQAFEQPSDLPKRSLKRRRTEAPPETTLPPNLQQALEAATRGQIILSKEELLNLTSAQHEDILSRVRAHRDLSAVEKKKISKNRDV